MSGDAASVMYCAFGSSPAQPVKMGFSEVLSFASCFVLAFGVFTFASYFVPASGVLAFYQLLCASLRGTEFY